jgi:hypothetical protein
MGRAIGLRADFDGVALRRLARASKSANQARRLLALAEIYDGKRRTDAARIGGVGLQIVRDWVVRFNARGPERPSRVSMMPKDKHLRRLLKADQSPRSMGSSVGVWPIWWVGWGQNLAYRSMKRPWVAS